MGGPFEAPISLNQLEVEQADVCLEPGAERNASTSS